MKKDSQSGKIIANIHFEDDGQDVQMFTVSFYPDFQYGEVISSDMQNHIWAGYIVLSGKPRKGNFINISKSPQDSVLKFKHKVADVDFLQENVKLTKKNLNQFIGWTSTKYNDYLGYGTKKEAVELAFNSLKKGCRTEITTIRNGGTSEKKDPAKIVFEILCASPVGESGTQRRGSYWNTKQSGDNYIVDCKERTIRAVYSKRTMKFLAEPQ